jgi:hypothetical protein
MEDSSVERLFASSRYQVSGACWGQSRIPLAVHGKSPAFVLMTLRDVSHLI